MLPKFDIVFLDMDGVLSDFQGAACKLHQKISPAELAIHGHWKPREWDMPKVFGISKEKFWAKIDESPNFWHDMPAMPNCFEVIKLARGVAAEYRVLTTPHGHADCYAGKFEWCNRVLGIAPYLCREKHLLAKPDRLLIDDSDENVDAFRAAGGSAILFPQHWNSAHDKAPFGVMFYLSQELAKLAAEQNSKKAARTINEARLEDYLTPTEPRPDPYVVKRDDNRWPHDIRPRGTWEAKPEADSPLSTVMQAAGDMAIGTQDTSDQPDHPATLLGYPVLPADPDSELAKKIAALKPGDIVLGPSLSASRGQTKQEMEDETWGIGR